MKHFGSEWDILGENNFLDAIQALKAGVCDAIYGKQGGILVLNKDEVVVYRSSTTHGIYFSVRAYLDPWRLLKKKGNVVHKHVEIKKKPRRMVQI